MLSRYLGQMCVLVVFLTAGTAGSCVEAQEKTNSTFVRVKVSDTLGSSIADARVTSVEVSSRSRKEQITDAAGNATVEVQSGSYDLTITKPGFKSMTVRNIEVKRAEHRQLDVVLEVAIYDCCMDPADPFAGLETQGAKLGNLEEPTQPVSVCELVSKPEFYNGKEVFVQAMYDGGNEWSVLDSPDCSSDKNLVWLEPSNANVRGLIKLGPKRESVRFNLRIRGVFMNGGTYGHQGRYFYKIVASEVSKVEKPLGSK